MNHLSLLWVWSRLEYFMINVLIIEGSAIPAVVSHSTISFICPTMCVSVRPNTVSCNEVCPRCTLQAVANSNRSPNLSSNRVRIDGGNRRKGS